MGSEEIALLIATYFDNMAAMKANGWLDIFAEDAGIHDPIGDPPRLVHRDSEYFFKMMSSFINKLEFKDDIFFVNNGAAVKWTMQVVSRKDRHATAEDISIFEINEFGKLQKVSSYWDEAALMAQLRG